MKQHRPVSTVSACITFLFLRARLRLWMIRDDPALRAGYFIVLLLAGLLGLTLLVLLTGGHAPARPNLPGVHWRR